MTEFPREPSRQTTLSPLGTVDPSDAALFLDFDGTLVDIAETPDAIVTHPGLQALLHDLGAATGGRVAIVSGRAVGDIVRFLPDYPGPIVGGHGAERRIGLRLERHAFADSPALPLIVEAAEEFAQSRPGLLVERKPTGVVLHYRRAPERAAEVEAFVRDLASAHEGVEVHGAKMAQELRPRGIGKRAAVEAVLDGPEYSGAVPVFFGDDATDEPAMALVLERGGVAVKVGEGETCARHRLDTPAEVRACLAAWIGTANSPRNAVAGEGA